MFFKKKIKQKAPPFWEEYLEAFKGNKGGKRFIQELQFVVLDTETSGLDPQKAEMLSLGGLHVQSFSIDVAAHLSIYFARNSQPNQKSIAIHGIVPKEEDNRTNEIGTIEKIVEFIGDRTIVGHHIRFDLMMLNRAIKEQTGEQLKNRWLDTAHLAKRLEIPKDHPINQGISLDHLCKYYQLKTHDRHTAIGDAYLTAIVFLKQLKDLEKRGIYYEKDLFRKGITTFRDNL